MNQWFNIFMIGESVDMAGDGSEEVADQSLVSADQNVPAAITDIGCEREINEDRYAVVDSLAGRAWIVCDGMGGAMGGELAAQLAIDAIKRALESREYENGEKALKTAIEEANRVIVLRRQNPAFSSMGTTVVGALINEDEIVISHAGDSRAYLVRSGEVQQLTVDHTYVQDLVDRGTINAEEALIHPQSHVLTKCLGADPRLELKSSSYWIWDVGEDEASDHLLLCSDGLYSHVTDDEIAEIVTSKNPQESCVEMVELAKSRGGYDNITIAVLPLGGQLHEERAEGAPKVTKSKPRQRKPTVNVKNIPAKKMNPKAKIALSVGLLFLGILIAGLLALLKF